MTRLETQKLILRDLEKGDEKTLQQKINDLDISKYLLVVPHPYSIEDSKWFVNKCIQEAKKEERTSYNFAIVSKENNELMGVIGLTEIDFFQGTGTIGYWLEKKYHRQGFMFEAAKEVLRFAFEDLNLRRLDVAAFVNNYASNNLIKKLGFEFEGLRKEKDISKASGEINDTNEYGLLKRNWKG